ncbi:2OG-Fe(II) oxygenase, partial [Bordetella pertussis]
AQGARGPVQASLRHGVSELRAGQRYTIGIIFHDAT